MMTTMTSSTSKPTTKTTESKQVLPPRPVTPPPARQETSLWRMLGVQETSNGGPKVPPQVVGHRGALYHCVENTRAGFKHCVAIGCDYVELDVFQVKDELVVFHGSGADEFPGDMTGYMLDQTGSITDLTYKEIQQLEFDPDYPGFPCMIDSHVKIPTLKQVLLDLKGSKTKIKIELKGPNTVEPTLKLVDELDMVHQCMYVSYYHERLELIRRMRPQKHDNGEHVYRTGALFGAIVPSDFIERALAIGASEVCMRYDTCTVGRIASIRKAGLQSMAWFRGPVAMYSDAQGYSDAGNEDESCYQAVMNTGVDQMCVNRPDRLLNLIKKHFK
ncbi:hypothetical protein MPSEU_000024000 [Mayamaea pseudoterrestris]|nr:hypothetical protein MPSEU_000024000 [Mayamaea pseudoterrestris]